MQATQTHAGAQCLGISAPGAFTHCQGSSFTSKCDAACRGTAMQVSCGAGITSMEQGLGQADSMHEPGQHPLTSLFFPYVVLPG